MIQGILNELVDPNTGAILNFHNTKNGNVCLHSGSYVSRKMFDLAKQAIISTSLAITSGTMLHQKIIFPILLLLLWGNQCQI